MLPLTLSILLSTSAAYKDVQKILNDRCNMCHTVTWVDKNWKNYDKVKENAAKIKLRVSNKTMPPGNVTQMTDAERETLIKWIDDGAKK